MRSDLLSLDALLARRFRTQALHAFRIRAPARRLAGRQGAPGAREQPGAIACALRRDESTWRLRSTSAPWRAPPEGDRAARAAPLAARRRAIASGRVDSASAVTPASAPNAGRPRASPRAPRVPPPIGVAGRHRRHRALHGARRSDLVVSAIAASGIESRIARTDGNDGRSRVQAPQPSATMPVNASEAATLR